MLISIAFALRSIFLAVMCNFHLTNICSICFQISLWNWIFHSNPHQIKM